MKKKRKTPNQKRREGAEKRIKQNQVANSNHLAMASAVIYMRAEHGYGDVRIRRLLNEYVHTMGDFAKRDLTPQMAMDEAQEFVNVRMNLLFTDSDGWKRLSSMLTLSCLVSTMKRITGWGKDRMDSVVESYMALYGEVRRGISTYADINEWCCEISGVDMRKELGW